MRGCVGKVLLDGDPESSPIATHAILRTTLFSRPMNSFGAVAPLPPLITPHILLFRFCLLFVIAAIIKATIIEQIDDGEMPQGKGTLPCLI